MKFINKLLLTLILPICICLILPSAGCETYQNSENCGGIVKGYKCLGEKEKSMTFPFEEHWTVMEIEIAFEDKSNNTYYPFILVSQSIFEYYNCSIAEELFQNKDFINTYSTTMLLEVKNSKAIFEINKAFKLKTSVYFYEGVEENNTTFKIEDLTDYSGYLKFN